MYGLTKAQPYKKNPTNITSTTVIYFVAFRFQRHVLLWYVVLNCSLQVHTSPRRVVHAYLQLLTLDLHSK